MRAVILAAGKGRRLSQTSPKPLTYLLGHTLIERTILSAKEHGITDFVIVVGYRGKEIIDYLGSGKRLGVGIQYVENREWDKENALSVLKAREIVEGESFILLMADHVFDHELLEELLGNKTEKCVLLIDKNIDEVFDKEDATKLLIKNGSPIAIEKNLPNYNAVDCGIFYCTPDIFDALRETVSEGKYRLSDAIQYLMDEDKLDVVDVGKGFWCDIDTPESLRYAEKKMLQSLIKPTDGPISKHINRKISTRISKVLVKTKITPNQLSIVVFALSLTASVFFFLGEYLYLLLGAILAQASSIVDGCDGEIARLKFQETEFGAWFDAVLDRYADAFLLFGLTYYVYFLSGNRLYLFIGFLAIIGTFMNSYTADKYDGLMKKKIGSKGHYFRMGRDVRIFIIFLFIMLNIRFLFLGEILNLPFLAILLIALLMNTENIRRVVVLYKNR
ncbi:MAG: sugar phosphate nucleotidyltransferase [Thermodesulfobacteriota bacterium]